MEGTTENSRFFLKRPSFLIIGILLAILLAFFFIGFSEKLIEKEKRNNASTDPSLPIVRIALAYPDDKEIPLSLPSFLVSYNVTPILSRASGYLKDFYVDIGDHVKRGQLLCEIEVPDVDAQLPPAQSNIESLQAKLEIAKVTAERWERLYRQDPDAVPKEEVDQTVAAYKAAIADVEAAKGNIEHLKVLQSFKNIYAPFEGVIVERNIDIGSLISAGNANLTQPYTEGYEVVNQPLFKISRTDIFRAFVEVPQPYYPYIQDGIKAEVRIPEYPNHVFSGIIDRNSGALDPLARTLLTQVNIKNREDLLRPGLYAEVTFLFKPYAKSFNIPVSALIIRDGPPLVAVVKEDDTVVLQEVQIGRDFGKSLQIVKGIKEGDKIILNPNFKIKNGTKVKVVQIENARTKEG